MPESQCAKRDAGGKKGKLLCCKRIFDRIKANLAEIQLKRHQNVQKIPGVNGLKYFPEDKPGIICAVTLKGQLNIQLDIPSSQNVP